MSQARARSAWRNPSDSRLSRIRVPASSDFGIAKSPCFPSAAAPQRKEIYNAYTSIVYFFSEKLNQLKRLLICFLGMRDTGNAL